MKNVNRHFPESEETHRVHIRNKRQGVGSTKAPHPVTETTPAEKKRDVFININDPKGTVYTDQTGKFPHGSIRGNKYQRILHEIDGNYTWIEPMKNKTEGEKILSRRRLRTYEGIRHRNYTPGPEQKISAAYRQEIKNTSMTFQLVPLDDHRRNLAEKEIQTWKDHFIGVMSGTTAAFPAHLWYQEIPQVERQLLLL